MSADTERFVYRNEGNAEVLAAVPEPSGPVLDVGCGGGDLAARLTERGHVVDGVTFSETEAALAREICRQVFVHDLETGLPAEAPSGYAVAICSHVLEHLARPEVLLRDLRERLLPDGSLLVALPNLFFYPSRLGLLRGRFDYEEAGLMDRTHLRWYSFASGARLLEDAGYRVERAWVDGTFPLWKLRTVLPATFVDKIGTAAGRRWPGLFGIQLLYRATPAPR